MRIMNKEGAIYLSADGWVLMREEGTAPDNTDIKGRWVLRDADDFWIDCDPYRNDVADRNELELYAEGDMPCEY